MTTLIHREQAFYEHLLINTHTEDDYADPQRAGILWTPSYKHTHRRWLRWSTESRHSMHTFL